MAETQVEIQPQPEISFKVEIPPPLSFSRNLLAYYKVRSEFEDLMMSESKISRKKLESLTFKERFEIEDRKMKEFSIFFRELMQNHSLLHNLKSVIPRMADVAKNWQQNDIVRIARNKIIEKMISAIENSNNKIKSTSYLRALDEEYLNSEQEEMLKKAQRKHGIY